MSSNLPPYSTFRTDPKGQQTMFPHTKSFGNVLTFTPPGFKQSLNVKFPDARLPVCVSCKKNFKTKDMCRVRNLHTRPPWTTAYICMTLDASCTDEDGKYVDKPFVVRMSGWRPFNVMEDFPANSKTPVCATCKKTNRTRSFCRDRHKHRKLPWCTVYVMLSTQESADPSTIVAAPSTKIETAKDSDAENNQGKINTSTLPSVKIESIKTDAQNSSLETPVESNKNGESKKDPSDANKPSSKTTGDDINDIPESRTMLIQINDEETTIKWLQLAHENDKGAWVPPPQLSPQQPKPMPPGIIQSAQKYSYPPVAPATMRGSKREADSSIGDPSQDPYHQHAMTGYNTAMGQPLAPALPHPYSYGRTAQQYIGHTWPYPTASIPPQPRQSMPHPYVTGQHRPISPAPAIGSPGGHMIGAPSLSPAVTAGEAAAMRRKKPRRDFEAEDKAESHHLHLHPTHPSPPPPPPAPIVPQLHHQAVNYSHVPLAPGPPLMHQPPQHPPGQIHHQEQQPWMVYQQMYQAQLQPVKNQYTTEPPRMTVRTPESTSRKFHQHDESPNNVTMTPGPGDGGGDHDSDDNDFNRQNEL